MPDLYDDLINGQNPLTKDAIKIEAINAPYGRTPVLLVRRVVYNGEDFIAEKTKGIVHLTDLKDMKRVLDAEEKEIKSNLEKISSENKANLSANKSLENYDEVHPLGLGMNSPEHCFNRKSQK